MQPNKSDFSLILNIIATSIDKLSEKEYCDLVSGKGQLVFCNIKDNSNKVDVTTFRHVYADATRPPGNQLHEKYITVTSKKEAYSLLTQPKVTKEILGELAKVMGVHLLKSMRKDKIIETIVEATIGAKQRSEAIMRIDLEEHT